MPLYIIIAAALGATYLAAGIGLPFLGEPGRRAQATLFGFSQIRLTGLILAVAAVAVAFVWKTRFPALRLHLSVGSPVARLGVASLAVVVFLALRTHFLNPDGQVIAYKIMRDIPIRGAHVLHDEMWELYLHSRFWVLTNHLFGWTVEFSYAVLSCLAGGVFVFLLLTYWRSLFADRALPAFALVVSSGFMQLFFGDVENYTLTAAWVMGYVLAALSFLQKRVSVVVPSLILAVSLTFHLLSGFLLPSLAYLWVLAWKRRRGRGVLMSAACVCLVVALTLLFFDRHGLPLANLWYKSHAFGHGGNFLGGLAVPSLSYHFAIANLAFLLVPAWVLMIPLLIYRRIPMDPLNVHLVIASGVMTAFVLLWKAELGVYSDWNLFAIAGLPLSLLVWRNVLNLEVFKENRRSVVILGSLFFLHSYSWIISNHLK